MKRSLGLFAAVAALALPQTAHAVGVVNLTWDSCTGPHVRSVVPGQTVTLFASVIGHAEAFTGYQVTMRLGIGNDNHLPDAWRFDASGGCQGGSRLTMEHLGPNKACPSFLPNATETSKEYEYDPVAKVAETRIAARLTSGSVTPNPVQRYFLASWRFDHTASVEGPGTPGVSCGGVERPICFVSYPATWTDPDGTEHDWVFDVPFASTNDHPNCPCASTPCTVPVVDETWGAIKGQYR
jgi:hypothetical protein